MLAILLAIQETMNSRNQNFKLILDIDESDACMKFEKNWLKKTDESYP